MKKHNLLLAIAMGSLISVTANAAGDDAIIKKARELQLSKKYDDAIKLYESSVKNNASERLYVDYAALLINLKKYKECDEILTKALKFFPDSLRIKNALGQAKYKLGDLSSASSLFSQVLGKDSNNKYAKTMLETIRKEKVASSSPIADLKPSDDSKLDTSDESIDDGSNLGGVLTFNVSDKLSKEEQEALAKKLYKEMADPELNKDDVVTFMKLHKEVIEKCPLTDSAQESCWRLSNLYMLGVEPAEYENCIAVLEHLLKQYPDTPLYPDAKNRLIIACQQIDDYPRICNLYQELFEKDPEPEPKTFMIRALEYADALAGAGKTAEAVEWYNKVIEKDEGKNALEARAARRKLGQLGQ
jgi:tetratricopeptide (TPR) repeat protein